VPKKHLFAKVTILCNLQKMEKHKRLRIKKISLVDSKIKPSQGKYWLILSVEISLFTFCTILIFFK
jgi:hypothetical protein